MSLAIMSFMKFNPPHRSNWQDLASPSFSRIQSHWLFRPGALTAGLRELGTVKLRVVREHAEGLPRTEAWMLARASRSPVWVREIIMSIDGIDAVFARSFTPLVSSHGLWQGMRRLQTRPLADMLYHNPQITRSHFLACRLERGQPLYRSVRRALPGDDMQSPHGLVARCSVFWRLGQPLLVAECFLPGFWPIARDRRYRMK